MILDTICSVVRIARILPSCALPVNATVGHIEGESINVAPIEIARIASDYALRGDRKAGDRIATLETAEAQTRSPRPCATPASPARRSRAMSFSSSRARRFAASLSSFGKPIFVAA